jgi:hypothetical protein
VFRSEAYVEFAAVEDSLEGDKPGRPRLVIGTRFHGNESSALAVYDLLSWGPSDTDPPSVWRYQFDGSDLPAEVQADSAGFTLQLKAAVIVDLDGDGAKAIAAATSVHSTSSAILHFFPALGQPTNVVLHNGLIEKLIVGDIDGDRLSDLICIGVDAPTDGCSLLVLRMKDLLSSAHDGDPMKGAASPGESATRSTLGQTCLRHLVIPQLPGLFSLTNSSGLLFHVDDVVIQPRPGKSPLIVVSMSAEDMSCIESDYIVEFDAMAPSVHVLVNQPMRDRAASWLAKGRTKIDFASPEYVHAWVSKFVMADTIMLDAGETPNRPGEPSF